MRWARLTIEWIDSKNFLLAIAFLWSSISSDDYILFTNSETLESGLAPKHPVTSQRTRLVVAQLAERSIPIPEVCDSNPVIGSGCVSVGRAVDSNTRGLRFESSHCSGCGSVGRAVDSDTSGLRFESSHCAVVVAQLVNSDTRSLRFESRSDDLYNRPFRYFTVGLSYLLFIFGNLSRESMFGRLERVLTMHIVDQQPTAQRKLV